MSEERTRGPGPDEDPSVDPATEAWLWDPRAETPAEHERLARSLGSLGWRGQERPREAGARRPAAAPTPAWKGALVALAAGFALVFGWRAWSDAGDAPSYAVHSGKGGVTRLAEGRWLDVHGSPHVVEVGDLGDVTFEPGARVKAEAISDERHEMFLARGRAHAFILAEPRVFRLGTPAALTVDLGCEYTVEVDEDERTHLYVETGRVAVEARGREVLVPAGAGCVAGPGGPSVPLWRDAPRWFRNAVRAVEADPAADASQGAFLAEVSDDLALYHLLAAPSLAIREAAWERLSQLHAVPAGVERDQLKNDPGAVQDAWWGSLAAGWWRGSPWS